jgi:hypothetical protein
MPGCRAEEHAPATSDVLTDAAVLWSFDLPEPGASDAGIEDLREAACAEEVVAPEPMPAVVQLVVDASGSMELRAPGGDLSRWEVTRSALWAALETMTGGVAVGMLIFPNQPTLASQPTGTNADPARPVTACVNVDERIDAAPLGPRNSVHRQRLWAALDAVVLRGGTPTHDAYASAAAALDETELPGERLMLLITDGQPTFSAGCRGNGSAQRTADPRPIIELAREAQRRGTRTFVIGAPGSEEVGVPVFTDARSWLSRMALSGGTAHAECSVDGPEFCHFDMTEEPDFALALNTALRQIAGQTLGCRFSLPVVPAGSDPEDMNVLWLRSNGDAEIIPRAGDDRCAEGWQYATDRSGIELCPATCDAVQSDPDARLELLLGCRTRVIVH